MKCVNLHQRKEKKKKKKVGKVRQQQLDSHAMPFSSSPKIHCCLDLAPGTVITETTELLSLCPRSGNIEQTVNFTTTSEVTPIGKVSGVWGENKRSKRC